MLHSKLTGLLPAEFGQRIRLLLVVTMALQKEKTAGLILATFDISLQRIRDNLRNFFLRPTTETLSFLQQLREAL